MDEEEEDARRAAECKKRFTTSKHHFHRIFKRFTLGVKKNEDETVLRQILRDLEEAYKNMEVKYALYVQVGTNYKFIRFLKVIIYRFFGFSCSGKSAFSIEYLKSKDI